MVWNGSISDVSTTEVKFSSRAHEFTTVHEFVLVWNPPVHSNQKRLEQSMSAVIAMLKRVNLGMQDVYLKKPWCMGIAWPCYLTI